MSKLGKVVKTFSNKRGKAIVVRYPTEHDLDQLLEFANNLIEEDVFISLSGKKLTREKETEYLNKILGDIQQEKALHFLAFHQDLLVGKIDVKKGQERREHIGVIGLAIHKNFRGEGIGTELLRLILEKAKEMGLTIVELSVFGPNKKAKELYKRHGFQLAGKLPKSIRYKNEFVDDIWMYKLL